MSAKFLLTGDCSLSVQMGEAISLEINQQVRMLFLSLTRQPIEGVKEMVPTYASLMVHYRPEVIRFAQLKEEIEKRLEHMDAVEEEGGIIKEIPICYGGDLGPDLEDCAAFENVSVEEFIRMHSQHEYYSYMLGFAPGHSYMARFEEPFHFKRRESPRVRISGGSIVVQLNLSNLIPFDQPCGWNIIGATPLTICDYNKVRNELGGLKGRKLEAGDEIGFVRPAKTLPDMETRKLTPEVFGEKEVVLRVVTGPQDTDFSEEELRRFFWYGAEITNEFDRMGCRLKREEPLHHLGDGNIITDGIAFGSIQVPPNGQPIIMLADRQSTGGYTKIGTVITVDLPKLTQSIAGNKVRFIRISLELAQELYVKRWEQLNHLEQKWCCS